MDTATIKPTYRRIRRTLEYQGTDEWITKQMELRGVKERQTIQPGCFIREVAVEELPPYYDNPLPANTFWLRVKAAWRFIWNS